MASYEHFDLLLGEALESINEAAGELKALSASFEESALKSIGRSICELWEIRDVLYKQRPDLKRDFVKEYSDDKQRYEMLSEVHEKALIAENNSDITSSINYYKELLRVSKFGYFRLLAEAGLYRLICRNNGNIT